MSEDCSQSDGTNNISDSPPYESDRKALSKPISSESFREFYRQVELNSDIARLRDFIESEDEKVKDLYKKLGLESVDSYIETIKNVEPSTDSFLKYYFDTYKSLKDIKISASAVNNLLKSEQGKISQEKIQTEVENLGKALVDNRESNRKFAIASRICSLGVQHLDNYPELYENFNGKNWNMTVVSFDIRSSTQLMLNARTPNDFVAFISDLSSTLSTQVKECFGIYDKFTGDGLLSFFPSFYSGEDHVYRALLCAESCHKIFQTIYAKHYDKFSAVRADVGLGIGVDVGETYLTFVNNEPTVIGTPVVYACRLSGAPCNTTYINQQVYEVIKQEYPDYFEVTPSEIEFKGQGLMRVYKCVSSKELDPIPLPEWALNEVKETNGLKEKV